MAENETPDIRTSARWIKVIRAIISQRPQIQVEQEIRVATKEAWSAIDRQFRRKGYSVNAIVQATLDGDEDSLNQAFQATRGHRFIKIISGCGMFMSQPNDVIAEAVDRHLTTVKQQIRDFLVRRGECGDFAAANNRVEPAFSAVGKDAEAFARQFLDSPRHAARLLRRMSPADMPVPSNSLSAGLLNMSLVNPAALTHEVRP